MARVFTLAEVTYRHGSDYDIVMLYQVFLGRNPENSQVVMAHRANTLAGAFRTFIGSDEFRDSVLTPVAQGEKVRRHDIVPRPTSEQLGWLFSHVLLGESIRDTLAAAPDWEGFFRCLVGLPGFLDPMPAPPAAEPPPLPEPPPALHAPVVEASEAMGEPMAAPSLAAVLARLDRIEARLDQLFARLDQPDHGPESPSKRRQAR